MRYVLVPPSLSWNLFPESFPISCQGRVGSESVIDLTKRRLLNDRAKIHDSGVNSTTSEQERVGGNAACVTSDVMQILSDLNSGIS